MKKLMAANWKMYKTRAEAEQTARELVSLLDGKLPADREVLVAPPFIGVDAVAGAFSGKAGYHLAGQNFYPSGQGAFTGEIAPEMLLDLGCDFALAGHSERRHIMGETDEFIGKKVAFGLEAGLSMILCVGELLEERKGGQVEAVLTAQLEAGLAGVEKGLDPDRLAVAYEPVWAIGSGLTAGPKEIAEAHRFVRDLLCAILGENGSKTRILYGGSVKPGNCGEIIRIDNVDGVLVGGASLSATSFSEIVLA
jgi:triosephosphate isomerase (TIM)